MAPLSASGSVNRPGQPRSHLKHPLGGEQPHKNPSRNGVSPSDGVHRDGPGVDELRVEEHPPLGAVQPGSLDLIEAAVGPEHGSAQVVHGQPLGAEEPCGRRRVAPGPARHREPPTGTGGRGTPKRDSPGAATGTNRRGATRGGSGRVTRVEGTHLS